MGLVLSTFSVIVYALYLFKITHKYHAERTACRIGNRFDNCFCSCNNEKTNAEENEKFHFKSNVLNKLQNSQKFRSRELSRIPTKKMSLVFQKSRKLR